MNEMDLIKDFCAEQVPPGPERLAAARARVVAGIQGAAPPRPAHSSPRRALRAMLTRPGLVISGGVAAAAAAVIVAGVIPVGAGPARQAGGAANVSAGGWDNLHPLGPPGVAEKTTVAGAQAKAGFPVPVPSTPAASRASLTQVWVSRLRPGRQVALVFDNGKIDILMKREAPQSALRDFRIYVAQKNKNAAPDAVIGKVNGRPALINPNVTVNFDLNGVLVRIFTTTKAYGTHTLLAIARSMR